MAAISLCLVALIAINLNSVKPDDTDNSNTISTTMITTELEAPTTKNNSLDDYNFEVHCKLQADGYPCDSQDLTRWYYDIRMEDCKIFRYFRCDSRNRNIFQHYDDCRQFCREPGPHVVEYDLPASVACVMQPDFGDCRDYVPMFYFEMSTRRCLGFAFSGCGGNQNRFYDIKDCQKVCAPATEHLIAVADMKD